MNENINLVEILKDCKMGTKFWSPICGELSFFNIEEDSEWPIRFKDKDGEVFSFMSNGFEEKYNVECLVFPDKNQRDWSKFKCHKLKFDPKTLKSFDRVLVKINEFTPWIADLFSCIDGEDIICVGGYFDKVIPYNDETKYLVGTSEEAPEYYRWWE